MKKNTLLELAFALLVFLYAARVVINLPPDAQWDCGIQYASAQAFVNGQNPYDRHEGVSWEYVYTPESLLRFAPMALFYQAAACAGKLYLKLGLLLALVVLWRRKFLAEEGDGWFYVFCLLAFNSTIYLDVRASNVSIEEQFLVWVGFYFFLRRNYTAFSGFIIAASLFKGLPALFLLVLWFADFETKGISDADERRFPQIKEKTPRSSAFIRVLSSMQARYFFGSLAALAAIHGVSFLLAPEFFLTFLSNALGHTGYASSSNFYFVKATFATLQTATGLAVPDAAQSTVYWVLAAGIAGAAVWGIAAARRFDDSPKWRLFILCAAYALIIPNFGDYSYVVVIVPAFFILKRTRLTAFLPLLILLSLSQSNRLPFPTYLIYVWDHFPALAAYAVMGLYGYEVVWPHPPAPSPDRRSRSAHRERGSR